MNDDLRFEGPSGETMKWLVLVFIGGLYTLGAAESSTSQDATAAILRAYRRYPIVAIGERHSIKEAGAFYVSLIRNAAFQSTVQDIVVEFASTRSQPVLDRYVNGLNVSPEELRHIWRDTTKVFAWESPIYQELLVAVRETNARLQPGKRLRILGGDSGIDWPKVRNHEQWKAFQPNDESFASVILRQVLAMRHKGLVILGGNHLTKNDQNDPNREPNATTLVERVHPRSMYVVLFTERKPVQAGESAPPVLSPWPEQRGPTGEIIHLGEYGDALLYLGNPITSAVPDWQGYRDDPEYLKELNRRARIEWGHGFDLRRYLSGTSAKP